MLYVKLSAWIGLTTEELSMEYDDASSKSVSVNQKTLLDSLIEITGK